MLPSDLPGNQWEKIIQFPIRSIHGGILKLLFGFWLLADLMSGTSKPILQNLNSIPI